MRRMLRGFGWVVFGLLVFVLGCNVVNRCGPEWGLVLSALCAGAAFVASEQAKALVNLFRESLAENGITQDAFAIDYGTAKSTLSNAFAHRESLSFHRAADADPEVWVTFAKKLLARHGHVVFERGVVADLVLAVQGQAEAFKQLVEPPRPQLAFSADRQDVA